MEQIGILGNGGQALELRDYIESEDLQTSFVAVDERYIDANGDIRQVNISSPNNDDRGTNVIAAIGAPGLKKQMLDAWPGSDYSTVVSSSAWVSKYSNIEKGVIIAPLASIGRNAKIGKHVIVNVGVTIAHDTSIGDYCTISPGVSIGGNVKIHDGVFIGIGATVINGIAIAPGCVVGAGAVVTCDIEYENTVVVGVPAKPIKVTEGWLNDI